MVLAIAGRQALVLRQHAFLSSVQPRSSFSPPSRLAFRKPTIARAPLACTHQDSAVLDAAWEILELFNKNDVKGLQQPSLESPDGVFALGASIVAAVEASRAQEGCLPLLGICANNSKEALTALQHWTTALSCDFYMPQIQRIDIYVGGQANARAHTWRQAFRFLTPSMIWTHYLGQSTSSTMLRLRRPIYRHTPESFVE